jgi:hypothetical protein
MTSALLEAQDFTLYQEGGKLMSGGFNIETAVEGIQEGGNPGPSLLDNLAMPLYYFSQNGGKNKKKTVHNYAESDPESNGIINNDLYDKLLGLMEYKEEKQPKKEEKREKVLKKRGTRRHVDNPKPKNGKKSRKTKPSPV